MKTIVTVHAGNIFIFGVGLAILAYASGVYYPPTWLNIVCSGFYSWKTTRLFPWTSVRYE